MAVDDDFYMRPGLLMMQTFGDDFVASGSAGTGSARAKAKAKAKGKSRPDRLLDVSLTRTQFTAKLMAQKQFCATAHQQALDTTDAFFRDNEELLNKYQQIKRAGVKEAIDITWHYGHWVIGRLYLQTLKQPFHYPASAAIYSDT